MKQGTTQNMKLRLVWRQCAGVLRKLALILATKIVHYTLLKNLVNSLKRIL